MISVFNDLNSFRTSLVDFGYTSRDVASDYANGLIQVDNGTLSDFRNGNPIGMPWTATLRPNAGIQDGTNVITYLGAISNNYAVDTVAPTITSLQVSDISLAEGENLTITLVFSEPVRAPVNFDGRSLDGGVTWTMTYTPDPFADTTFNFSFHPDNFVDFAGNRGAGGAVTTPDITLDFIPPTSSITLSNTHIIDGETSDVTITFSEAVTGFSNADLTIENGTLSDVASSDGGVTWTATFTPATGITDATNVISLDATGVSDIAGNAGAGTTSSDNYAIDTNRAPTSVTLSANTVGENAANRKVIGALAATDPESADTHTFTLLDNAGGRFAVSGNKIVVADSLGLDFEQAATHTITVRATDQGGKFYDKALTISLTNVTGETVYGDARDNTIAAGAGADRLYGGLGTDRMSGGNGDDIYYADRPSDTVTETNSDRATGGYDSVMSSSSYWLSANVEALFLGGTNAIYASGNALNNAIAGNGAGNIIDGGLGNDYLTGGAGRDLFQFSTALNATTNKDFITDFNATDDTLQLSVGAFHGLAIGDLNPNAFYAAAGAIKAYDASDRIVYNTSTGDLYFDADGLGGAAAVKFATLRGKPALSAADFDIVGVV